MTTAAQPAPAAGSGAMFDRIAHRYDLLNRLMSFGIDRGWRRRTVAALALGPRPRVLDLATGTGDLALDIARRHPDAHIVGVDPSLAMLERARHKATRRGLGDRFDARVGVAEDIEWADASFDAVTIAFGIRNVPSRDRALGEMARVTRPGGRVAILELGDPTGPILGRLARFHVHQVVPRLGALLSGAREYRYLARSIAGFPPAAEFVVRMRACGLAVIDLVPMTFGACTLFLATPARGQA